jgi:hypothetical protein
LWGRGYCGEKGTLVAVSEKVARWSFEVIRRGGRVERERDGKELRLRMSSLPVKSKEGVAKVYLEE